MAVYVADSPENLAMRDDITVKIRIDFDLLDQNR